MKVVKIAKNITKNMTKEDLIGGGKTASKILLGVLKIGMLAVGIRYLTLLVQGETNDTIQATQKGVRKIRTFVADAIKEANEGQ